MSEQPQPEVYTHQPLQPTMSPPPQSYTPAPAQYQSIPPPVAAAPQKVVPVNQKGPQLVITTPTWYTVLCIVSFVLTLPVLGIAGWITHGVYIDCNGLAIAECILTWIALAYLVLSEKVTGLHLLYHIFAHLAVITFQTIMWLATTAYVAHTRSTFKYDVLVSNCYNDGSLTNSNYCTIWKRGIPVLGKGPLAALIVASVISAIQMILWIILGSWLVKTYLATRKPIANPATLKAQPLPLTTTYDKLPVPPQPTTTYTAAPPVYHQSTPQHPPPQATFVQSTPSPTPMSVVSAVSAGSPIPGQGTVYPEPTVISEASELPSLEQQGMNPPVEMHAGQH